MRKPRYDEVVEEDVEREAAPLRDDLEAWMHRVADEVAHARPERPDGVQDRAAEIWGPLLAMLTRPVGTGRRPRAGRAATS